MNKFEEANSTLTYIDPKDYSNPNKINSAYYHIRGIPKNISVCKQQDFTDLSLRHNKVPLTNFSDQNSQELFDKNIYHKNDLNPNYLQNSNLSTHKTSNYVHDNINNTQQQSLLHKNQIEHNLINSNNQQLTDQVRSLSRDKQQLEQQIIQLQKRIQLTEKKINLIANEKNVNKDSYVQQLNTFKSELEQKQNQLRQRQQSKDDVFDKKLNLLAQQISKLENNISNKNCNDCDKKDVTIRCLEHHYDPYKYTQKQDNYFDVPEYRQIINYEQPEIHHVNRYSYTQPETYSVRESLNLSPLKYKYSYTDTSTRQSSPYRNCTFTDSISQNDSNRVIKQVRYSSPSPIRRNTIKKNFNDQNFTKNKIENQVGRQNSSRGQLLGQMTTNNKVTYISNTTERISYRKLTPEIYEQENPEFTQILQTSNKQNPTLVINKNINLNNYQDQRDFNQINQQQGYHKQETQKSNQNYQRYNQDNMYKRNYQNNDVKIIKRTRTRSPVHRLIK